MKNENTTQNPNIKLTNARKELLEILQKSKKPLCYEDMKNEISMDKATFYRNIAKFEEEQMIQSFESNDKKRYFEIKKIPHAHFICNICNKIECLDILQNLQIELHTIDNIIIKGKCSNCI